MGPRVYVLKNNTFSATINVVATLRRIRAPVLISPEPATSTSLYPFVTSPNTTAHLYDDHSDRSDLNWVSLLLIIFIFSGALGNSLVCISILISKKLQTPTNCFLFSLAIADFLVSVCVMPFGLINELYYGFWPFGYRLCIVYVSGDVFFCSVSIVHMSVISFDRYWGISRPFKTGRRSRKVLLFKILGCWVLTIIIACPVAFLAYWDSKNVYQDQVCQIFVSEFQIYGSIVTFFIPFFFMAFAYIATVRLLKQQESIYKGKKTNQTTLAHPNDIMRRSRSIRGKRSTITNPTYSSSQYKSVRRSTSLTMPAIDDCPEEENSLSSALSPTVDTTSSNCPPIAKPKDSCDSRTVIKTSLRRVKRFISSNKRRNSESAVRNEQKATKVLGLVFVAFFICWVPFFLTNMTLASCGHECIRNFPVWLGSIFLWMGYLSSVINPIIYTIFNKLFRQTFKDILLCRVWKSPRLLPRINVSKLSVTTMNDNYSKIRNSPSLLLQRSPTPKATSSSGLPGGTLRHLSIRRPLHSPIFTKLKQPNPQNNIKGDSIDDYLNAFDLEVVAARMIMDSIPSTVV